ncbi:helix-turn-helix domain-containing protein [Antrihabitans sp. YC3-6]|uniref:Helix-turn-helix domain-containing protein n=1 Tax=Antrihabitans stalagmiti TaxID=2799499 RepID=A0A934U3W9_9NOCA|nr:helix-turn-helix domain-containing protein [Antrihabitans stalagmiti]MBJ8340005.1 helix-turn-helix domain-containing protein [Antrihabitans stalagmiti]
MTKTLVDYSEAAQMLSASYSTVQRMVRTGKLHPILLGARTPRIAVEEIRGLVTARDMAVV